MHALKWWKSSTRMFFEGEGQGSGGDAGSGSASSGSSAPPSGGEVGGGSAPASPDGGGGAPDSLPVEAQPSSPDSVTPSGDMDWSNLGSTDDLDYVEVPAIPPIAAPAAPPKKYGNTGEVVPPAPAATPPTQKPPAAPEAPAPTGAAPAPTPPAPTDQAPPVQLSPSDPGGIARALEANRDASIAHLAQSRFALSQEDIAELEDNAAAFVPKMMARVHHEAQVSMMKFLAQAVPGMMQQFTTVSKANTEAEEQFFEAHKGLGLKKTDKVHRETAYRLAKLYRQSNPDMPMDQLIAEVGPIVAMSLKLSPVPQAIPGSPGAPPQPAPTGRPTGFRPAVNGGGGASPNPEPANEWAGIGQDYD